MENALIFYQCVETMWRICILILEIKGLNSSGHSKEILVIFKKETLCIILRH